MLYGVIDIGTNTIRSHIFEINGDNIKSYGDLAFESEILKYTVEGCLTEEGQEILLDSLEKSLQMLKTESVERVFSIATSAMRDVKNFDEVNDKYYQRCRERIELLSPEEEALCDFYALGKIKEKKAVLMDMGGGSCQLIQIDDDKVTRALSFPIGVKRLYNKFGKYDYENNLEIKKYLEMALEKISDFNGEALYVMGGTMKKISKLMDKKEFSTEDIAVMREALKNEDLTSLSFMRNETIPFGTEILETVCRICKTKKICVVSRGVRDGYIRKNIIG